MVAVGLVAVEVVEEELDLPQALVTLPQFSGLPFLASQVPTMVGLPAVDCI